MEIWVGVLIGLIERKYGVSFVRVLAFRDDAMQGIIFRIIFGCLFESIFMNRPFIDFLVDYGIKLNK